MAELEVSIQPRSIQEAAEDMITFISSAPVRPLEDGGKYPPMEFATWIHRNYGPFFRNSWNLWWYPNHDTKLWPEEKPALLKCFEKEGITNPDDIVVLIAIWAWGIHHNIPVSFQFYKQQCVDHWSRQGYPGGVWNREMPPRRTDYDGS